MRERFSVIVIVSSLQAVCQMYELVDELFVYLLNKLREIYKKIGIFSRCECEMTFV